MGRSNTKMKFLLVLAIVGYAAASDNYAVSHSHTKSYSYRGQYHGKCSNDGIYYNDASSFVMCSNGNAYHQPCAPGSRNGGHSGYSHGNSYGFQDFCGVNLVDYGYAAGHSHGRYSHGHNPDTDMTVTVMDTTTTDTDTTTTATDTIATATDMTATATEDTPTDTTPDTDMTVTVMDTATTATDTTTTAATDTTTDTVDTPTTRPEVTPPMA